MVFEDSKKTREQFEAYFRECDEKGEPYTMSGLALSAGTNRMTLLNYKKEQNTALPAETAKEISELIKWAKAKCENYAEKSLFTNRNQAGVIFNLKNNYSNWVDKQEVIQSTENKAPDLSGLTEEELKKLLD